MSIGGGITILILGAILTFALTGSVRGVDLHIVGVILMLGGALGLLLPLLIRARAGGRRRPKGMTARSRQDVIDEGSHTLVKPPRNDPSS
jgi:uncharacterized protein DUF6458